MLFFAMFAASLVAGQPLVSSGEKVADALGLGGHWRLTTLALDPAHRNVNGTYLLELDPVATVPGDGDASYAVRLTRVLAADKKQTKDARVAAPSGTARLNVSALLEAGALVGAQGAFEVSLADGKTTDAMRFELFFARAGAKKPWALDGYWEHTGPAFFLAEEDRADKGDGHGSTFWGVFKGAPGDGKAIPFTHRDLLSCLTCCDAFMRCGGQGPGSCNGSNMCFDSCVNPLPEDPRKARPSACIDENLRAP